jgi:hypothetical protein
VVSGAAALAAMSLASPAGAQDARGERLFQEGRALMLEGRYAEACPKLEESQRIDPHVGTLLNLAACHERQGKIATAWVEFQQALAAARAEGQAEREELARARIEALDPRVPRLSITVPASSRAAVSLDGAPIHPGAFGKEMPVDPGGHVVVAVEPGKKTFSVEFELRESEHKTIAVPALDALRPAAPAPRAPEPVKAAAAQKPPLQGSRWLLEAGLFGSSVLSSPERAELVDDEGSIRLVAPNGNVSTCASRPCSYRLSQSWGFVSGLNLFTGYAVSDSVHIGGRLIAGARVGGGSLIVTGPSMSFHAVGPLWLGAAAYLGSGAVSGSGDITPRAPYYQDGGGGEQLSASTFGFGTGVEVALRVWETPRSALAITVMSVFLFGDNGNTWAVPIGASYRFR